MLCIFLRCPWHQLFIRNLFTRVVQERGIEPRSVPMCFAIGPAPSPLFIPLLTIYIYSCTKNITIKY
jgi:hypothetical protein